jgi:hypothetical protein
MHLAIVWVALQEIFEIGTAEALTEPAADRRQQIPTFVQAAPVGTKAGEGRGRA